jgi:predicted transcriptional regulator
MSKRPDGVLEHDVLRALWGATEPLLPTAVRDVVPGDLAYTSIATTLTRLHAKGLVERSAIGRAFAYRAVVSESDLAARRMTDVLTGTTDRDAVLAGLVSNLTKAERKALRAFLERTT